MTETLPAAGPTGFTCPLCGSRADAPAVNVDARTVRRYPQVPLWDGGPTMEDRSQLPKTFVVDRAVSTDACSHVFWLSEWTFTLFRHEESGREWVELTRKPIGGEEDR